MTIARRLRASFGIMVLIFLAAGVIILLSERVVRDALDRVLQVEAPARSASYEMEINTVEISRDVLAYLGTGDPTYRDQFEDDKGDFERYEARYDELIKVRGESGQEERIDSLYREYVAVGESLMDGRDERGVGLDESTRDGLREFAELQAELDAVLDSEVQPVTSQRMAEGNEEAKNALRGLNFTVVLLLLIGVVVGSAASYLIGRGIVRSVHGLKEAADRVGRGELDRRAEIGSRDELGGVAHAFNDMLEKRLETEEALRENGERFQALAEAAFEGVVISVDGKIMEANAAFVDMVGLETPTEAVGASASEFVDPGSWDLVSRNISNGSEEPYEAVLRRRDGSTFEAEIRARMSSYRGSKARVTVIRDITGQKENERRLRAAEARYRALVEQMPAVTYTQEIGGPEAAAYMSPQIEALTGYSPEECKDPDLRWRMVHPDDRERLRSEDAHPGEPGEVFTTEYRVVHRDGRIVWVRNESVILEGTDGTRFWQGFMVDISERKRSEEALRGSEERYRLVARATDEAIWDSDLASDRQAWDGAVERMLGYPSGQVTDTAWWEGRVHPEDRGRVLSGIGAVLRGGGGGGVAGDSWREEYRFLRADGGYSVVVDRALVVRGEGGEPVRVVGSMVDVTERRRAEEKVRTSEAELRALFAAMNDMIIVLDREGRYLRVAPTNPPLLHRPSGEVIGRTLREVLPPEQAEEFLGHIGRALETRLPVEIEYSQLIGGEEVWFAATISPMGGEEVLWIARDVTERRRIEEELRESERRYRSVVESVREVIFQTDARGLWTFLNPAWAEITGFAVEESLGESYLDYVHPDDREASLRDFGMLVESEKDHSRHEVRYMTKDGGFRWIELYARPVLDEDGNTVVGTSGTLNDITKRKGTEEEIREANRRLEELAVLKADFTAMVAHELDTPLAIIRGYVDMLATGDVDPADQVRILDIILNETDKLGVLVSDVRGAASVERDDFVVLPRWVPVDSLLAEVYGSAKTLLGGHPLEIKVNTQRIVWADPYRIGQVLRNLLSNAAKYSPEGAPIELRARPNMGGIRFEVIDRGPGIHPDDVARVFERFGRGRGPAGKVPGVGLGLYLSRRILRAHGSELTLDSKPDVGSVFGFTLKVAK